jgi:hypothetical protein
MANPDLPVFGALAADGIFDATAPTPVTGIKRGYGSETSGGDPLMHQGIAAIPAPAGAVHQVAAATATAAIAAVVDQTGYLAGFSISGGGATGTSRIRATIAGLAIGTMGIDIVVPAGAALAITPIFVTFPNPIPSSAANTAITLSVPSFGTGNLDVSIAIWGYTSA